VFGERSSGACGNTEQACIVFEDAKPFAAACWRYGRTLAVGLAKEEELLSDADLACFVCHHDSADMALQGERLQRLLLQEHHLSSLAAAMKMHDVPGSRRKKNCTALIDVQDVQRPTGGGQDLNGWGGGTAGTHDWDTLFRCLGWAGSCNSTRSTTSQWKQWSQQLQGTCRAVGGPHSVSKRACDLQEAVGEGMAEEFTGLAGDTWSIDSMTFSSLHLMSVQSRSRQRRTGAVKQSPPGERDAPSAPTALATLNNSGSCSLQASGFARRGGRREDSDIREFLHVLFGSRSDCSASQTTAANIATRTPREMISPAMFMLSNGVQQNPESANTGPAFGAAVIMRNIPSWERDTVAVTAAYPRPHYVP